MEISNERINKWLFTFIVLAILPTCILGGLGVIENYKIHIWIWDVLIIGFMFLVSITLNKSMKKNRLLIAIYFLCVMAIQFITYTESLENRLIETIYMALPIIYFVHFFSSFICFSGIKVKQCDFLYFFEKFFYFVFIACIYNLIINNKIIFNAFNIQNKYIHISSFFPHRNAFGQFLFLGIVSNIYMIIKKKDKKLYFALMFLFFNLIFSFSRTSIFTTIIFCMLFIMFNIKNKKQLIKIVCCGIIGVVIITTIVMTNEKILDFLNQNVFRVSDGLTGRDKIWEVALELLDEGKIFTGYGLGSSSAILNNFNLSNSHNTYLEALIVGGIVLFLLYVICYIFVFDAIRKIKDKQIRDLYLSFYFSFIIYCFFEKVLIFSTGYAAVFFTIFFVIIPIMMSQNSVEGKENV